MVDARTNKFWPKRWLRSMAGTALAAGIAASTLAAQHMLVPPDPLLAQEKVTEKGPEPREAPHDPKEKKPEVAPAKGAEKHKLITFEFSDARWDEVIRWFVKESGLGFASIEKPPTGSFNFTPPRGPDGKVKQYTITEVIDILNDAMLAKGYLLMRREGSFTIIPADQTPDISLVPPVSLEELTDRGAKEYVKVVIGPLKTMNAEDLAVEIKPLMGKFSVVNPLSQANKLVLMDQAANLRTVLKHIQEIEDQEGQTQDYRRVLKNVKAREAREKLIEALGNPQEVIRQAMQQPAQIGRDGKPIPVTPPKVRMYSFVADERLNAILVSGPSDIIAKAKKILDDLDQGAPVLIGEPSMKTYQTPPGAAEILVKTLTDIYKPSATLKIAPVGQNQIMVYAYPQEHFEIARLIAGNKLDENSVTKFVPLTTLDAAKVATQLKGMFADPVKGGPFISEDERNAIVIKGTAEQVQQVVDAIRVLEPQNGANLAPRRTTITVKEGNAINLAETVLKMMKEMGYNPKLIKPGFEDPLAEPKKAPPKDMRKDDAKDRSQAPPPLLDARLVAANQPLVDPREKKTPVVVTAVGNRLQIESDDPEAVAKFAELVRLLTSAPGEGDFTVIRLKNANAAEASHIIDEWFNGPQQQRGGRGGGGGGAFGFPGGPGGGAPAPAEKPRIRVVADPGTNSLLVRASAVDLMTIRMMLKEVLDSGVDDSDALTKHFVIKMKHANASDAYHVIHDVFREYTRDASTASTSGVVGGAAPGGLGIFGAFGGRGQQPDPTGRPRQIQLSLSYDDQTNSLVMNCPQKLYENILALATELDKMAADSTRTVKIMSVKGLDPFLVQQAIDAIQGRRTIRNSAIGVGRGQGGMGGGLGGQSPFGGGVSPFGGSPFGGGVSPFGGGASPFGGGGGRGGRGGGGPPPSDDAQGRGRDFFESRDMDVPSRPLLYDPRVRHDFARNWRQLPSVVQAKHWPGFIDPRLMTVAFLQDDAEPKDEPKKENGKDDPKADTGKTNPFEGIRAPRSTVNVEALEEIGVIVISAGNPQDLEDVLNIIKVIEGLAKESEPTIKIIPLEFGDATSIVNTLNQVLSRIQVVPGGNVLLPGQQQQPRQGIQGGGFGGPGGFGGGLGGFGGGLGGLGGGLGGFGGGLGGLGGGLGGFGGGLPGFGGLQNQAQTGSILMLPLSRFNSILVGAPASRIEYVVNEIKKLDRPVSPQGAAHPFPLKKASAITVATEVQQFWSQRYTPGESQLQNQIRVTYDISTNTVFVQAAPADLEEIRGLIERIDNTVSSAVNELRIIRLRNAQADQLATTILTAITSGIYPQTQGGAGGGLGGGGLGGGGLGGGGLGGGGLGGGGLGGGGFGGGGLGGGGGFGGGGLGGGLGGGGLGGGGLGGGGLGGGASGGRAFNTTKTTSLRFVNPGGKDGMALESGKLEDFHLTADVRTNTLIVSANADTMPLILALIRDLDTTAAARATINIFTLKRADAVLTANLLQQLFYGGGTTGAGGRPGGGGGAGGAGASFGGLSTTGSGGTRALLSLSGDPSAGAVLIDLRISVDDRTNSIIVAGSPNDLETIGAIIARLEDAAIRPRISEVIKLRNAAAADVVNALQAFFTNSLTITSSSNQLSGYQEFRQAVVLQAEPVTNTVLISASEEWFPRVIQMIQGLDRQLQQVAITCMIAEVHLTNTEEFGVELGLQSPILFTRGLVGTTSSVGLTNAVGNAVPAGTTITSTNPLLNIPGFNFVNPNAINAGLPNYNLASPSTVGYQGLNYLGVGRTNSNGISGFLFSGASNTVNILVRALKTQDRIDLLNAPNLQLLDNQVGIVSVGQIYPYITGGQFTALGTFQPNITYRTDVGVTLQVTPRISPEGRILMRVEPSIIEPQTTPISLGNGLFATAFNNQSVQTTVLAEDGETVVIGGLVSKSNLRNENKIPFLGDLPFVGALFRYRTQSQDKRELIVVLTPRIIRTPEDADRYALDKMKLMNWNLKDIERVYGQENMELLLRKTSQPNCAPGTPGTPGAPLPPATGPIPVPDKPALPAPQPLPPVSKDAVDGPSITPVAAKETTTPEEPKKKESRGWNLFNRN